jgi:hypothetical protein
MPKDKKAAEIPVRLIRVADLKPHPRNYRTHPDDQLAHIMKSISENGVYRPVVAAEDLTILAGHGVVAAATKMGRAKIPVVVLKIKADSPQALRLLAGDNEISNLVELDDRTLTEILKQLRAEGGDDALLGTGFDQAMLANLLFITRPRSEIADINVAAAWAGMPQYDQGDGLKLIVNFQNVEDRAAFAKVLGVTLNEKTASIWYPPRERGEISEPSPDKIRFVEKE